MESQFSEMRTEEAAMESSDLAHRENSRAPENVSFPSLNVKAH